MGALHEGHAALVRAAGSVTGRARAPVVVTIFVNPTQFGPREDFARYPRTLEADLELCRAAGADAVFVPSVEMIYPRGLDAARDEAAAWQLPPAAIEPGLEDRCRPGHFGGVCLVVARLFELCRPGTAYFGEKDWQQLRVISQMVERERRRDATTRRFADLRIVSCPTVRERDGLAMSSRNRYLGAEERRRATALWRAIALARASSPTPPDIERSMQALLEREGLQADYAVVRDAASLLPPVAGAPAESLRVLIAARLGTTRLIDNAGLLDGGAAIRGGGGGG